MSRTNTKAYMSMVDITASEDAEYASPTSQTFSELSKLSEGVTPEDYATLELNQFVLDDSKVISNPTAGFWSSATSNEDCTFDSNPTLNIAFDSVHSSSGITLTFAENYCEVKITWLSTGGTYLYAETFKPDEQEYFCKHQQLNYGGLKIEFIRTIWPKTFVKLSKVLYGAEVLWSDDDIVSATVNEEVDATGATLPINTATLEVNDEDNQYDPENSDGFWKSIQKTQPINIYETVDGKEIPIGKYFVDTFSFQDNKVTFELISHVGLLDNYDFIDGEVYQNADAETIIKAIFASADTDEYTIADELIGRTVSGYLANMTCREALQQVCFAIGAIANTSRDGKINVYTPNRATVHTIDTDRKFDGKTNVTLDEYVSGLTIKYNTYAEDAESKSIYEGTISAGTTRILLSDPVKPSSVTTTSGTLANVSTNYLDITSDAETEVTITGIGYQSSEQAYTLEDSIEAGQIRTVKEVSGCTMYAPSYIKSVARYLLDYYALRKTLEFEYILESEKAGEWEQVKNVNGDVSATFLESQSIDLVGGFIATAKCRGYTVVNTSAKYSGEIYAGETV
jgi:hypothetical protein